MKKEKFIEMVEKLIKDANEDELNKYQEALEYFEIFKSEKEKEKPEFTENGLKILKYMQDNFNNFNNIFKAKEIGEGLFMSSRSVSGSLRKLVTDNYVEKIGNNPSIYSLTEKGKEKSF
jgi:Fic family protein